MANKDDYLTDYRCFFENFAQTLNAHDPLPVKLGSYKLSNTEVIGGIVDWTTQYLNQKKCPQTLLAPLTKIIIEEVRALCKKQTIASGFNPTLNVYDPLRLMQCVVTKINEVCLRYLDNSKLCSLPSTGPPYNIVSMCAIKNSRRRMEDRYIVIHDLNTLFTDDEVSPSSYYAIFDGHAGHDAAAYSCAHLHQFLGESKYFNSNPEQALREAFLKTDTLFNDKCKQENFRSGTTALCVLLKHKEKNLYISWVGDSQAVLVRQGQCIQCVQPHKPCREDEKHRIEQEGGAVIYWGMWRVNGQLAVSRAIGDLEYKPYVTAAPDIVEIPLSGMEDFLILGCDGLWDVISEKEAARHVYEDIINNPDDIDSVSQHLVQVAKEKGSCDNISVIVVFLREPSKVVAEAHWATRHSLIMDTLDNSNATNPFENSNNDNILEKEDYVMNLAEGYKQNGTENIEFLRSANGKCTPHDFDDEDLGPETDVDTIDDVLLSSTVISAKNLMDEIVNNNSLYENEKATLETESEFSKNQQLDHFEDNREDTPTPPADLMQDTSGLVDNVAESGEESEDEWNYIKGDQAEKENLDLAQNDKEICDLTSHLDADMSQLNPNAAEFVPVSPKRNTTSPAYQALMDDLVIAQSPKRIANNDYDINVPHPQEFESEIKSRPSDVQENTDEDESDNMSALTSQALMENLLNGKSIEEIEFQPNSTPIRPQKTSEFHFGPNATPFSTPSKLMDQSEALSTKAVVDDESNYLEDPELDEMSDYPISAKEEDPMSMSFYQDKEDANINPFDLNKVQLLPENIDDFLEKPQENESLLHDTISDLPEHDPLAPVSISKSPDLKCESIVVAQSPVLERENTPIHSIEALTPDLPSEQIEIHNASSPFEDDTQSQSSGVHSPDFKVQSPCFEIDVHAEEAKSQISETDLDIRSPIMGSPSPVPEIQTLPELCSPAFDTHTSESVVLSTFDVDEAIGACSPIPIMHSPNLENEVIEIPLQSPISRSPISEICQSHSPLQVIHSPTDEKELTEANSSPTIAQSLEANKVISPIPTAESPLNISEGAIESDLTDPIFQSSLEVHELVIENSSPISNSPVPINVNEAEIEISSPVFTTQSPVDVLEVAMEASSPVPTSQSPIDDVQEIVTLTYSPVPDIEPFGAVPEKTQLETESSSSLLEDTRNVQFLSYEVHSDTCHESEAAICEAPKDLLSPVKSPSPQPLIQQQPKCPTPTQELDSPIEDMTSSVNDSPASTASLTTEKPMATVTTDDKTKIVEVVIEGVDVQSFLERSLVPDLQSPLSSVTSPQSVDENRYIEKPSSVELCNFESETMNKYVLEDFDIRSEIIAPEYPVHTVTTPSEESRTEDLLEYKKFKEVETVDLTLVTSNTTATESDATLAATTDSTLAATTDVTLASAAVAVTAATAVAAVAAVAEKKPATKTKSVASTITKKPATKSSVTAVNKPLNSISKNSSKSIPLKSSMSAATKVTLAKTPPVSKTMNGDVKPSLTKKLHTTSTTPKLASTKLLPTKPSKPMENKARPIASTKTTTRGTIKPSTTKTTAAAAKPTAAATSKSPAPLKTAPPKPKSTMAPLKPRPISKAPDAEKQLKETVNKQITARTPPTNRTTSSPGKPLTPATRKIDIKSSGVGSTLTKTAAKSTDVRKPTELIRPITKPKTTGVVKKTISKNGTNEVTTKVSKTIQRLHQEDLLECKKLKEVEANTRPSTSAMTTRGAIKHSTTKTTAAAAKRCNGGIASRVAAFFENKATICKQEILNNIKEQRQKEMHVLRHKNKNVTSNEVANNDYDINVPHPQEFESEIKFRPSDVQENTDEDESDNMSALTSQAFMENLLNGKSIEEIEFQPNSTPIRPQKTSEFYFGPNATPFSTPSKLMDQSDTLSLTKNAKKETKVAVTAATAVAAVAAVAEKKPATKKKRKSLTFVIPKIDATKPSVTASNKPTAAAAKSTAAATSKSPAPLKTAPPKPNSTMAPPKPRPHPTNRTTSYLGKPSTLATRKIYIKSSGVGSTLTKTAAKSTDVRKPAELIRPITKPKTTAESPLNISEDPIFQSSLEVHEVLIENSSPISNSPVPINLNEAEIEISLPVFTTQSPVDVLEVAMEVSSPIPTTQSLLDDVLEIATLTYSPVPDIEPFGAVPEKTQLETESSSSLLEDTRNVQL